MSYQRLCPRGRASLGHAAPGGSRLLESALRTRLHGQPVDAAFEAWSGIWLSPTFRSWNITGDIRSVRCPVLVIQGEDDPFATLGQVDAIASHVEGPAERFVLPACGHVPHKEKPEATLAAMTRFVTRCASSQDR